MPCDAAPAARRTAPSGGAALFFRPFAHQRLASRTSRLVERRMAQAAAAQQRELVGAQVRAAHRKAVAGIARALDRRLLLVVPDPFLDEGEGHVLELDVGLIR